MHSKQRKLFYISRTKYLFVFNRTASEVVSGVVLKCFNSKPKLKEQAQELCMNYVELDKQELVAEELIKGFANKQPKIVQACVETLTKALM